ncbi:MAG: AEC family transporter [Alphaproteobacteria bacterium]|nr:AEC family transporter [Alphaproteobacteria bacterium]
MIAAIGAIAPVFAPIVIGWGLKRQSWLPEPFWLGAERIVYWVLFPALLCISLGSIDASSMPVAATAAALGGAILAVTAGALVLAQAVSLPAPQLTSVVQGCLRPNIYIGFAVAAALWGGPGLALFSLAVAIAIPLVNLIAVVLLTRFGTATPSWRETARQIAVNPIILGCLAGILPSLSPAKLPVPVADTLKLLGQASLPLALLSVGASLDFTLLKGAPGSLLAASFGKLVALPAATWFACRSLGLDPLATAVCTLFNALPASPSSYVMARQMGGDHRLMAAILTCQTLLAVVTLPLLLSLVRG